jgi:hypothetical protein
LAHALLFDNRPPPHRRVRCWLLLLLLLLLLLHLSPQSAASRHGRRAAPVPSDSFKLSRPLER